MDASGNLTDIGGNVVNVETKKVKKKTKGKKGKIYIVEASSSSEDDEPVSNDMYKLLQKQKIENH